MYFAWVRVRNLPMQKTGLVKSELSVSCLNLVNLLALVHLPVWIKALTYDGQMLL